MKTYALREKGQKKLGDKQELLYGLEQTRHVAELKVELRSSCQEKVSQPSWKKEAFEEYEKIRKHLGITAGRIKGTSSAL
jgi:hypothetical protein